MSDNWRPFILRRTEGGDTLRGVGWQGVLRYGPLDYPFDIVTGITLTGSPVGYDTTLVSISVPPSVPNRGEMVLVRGGFGYPTTPLDGVAVWYHPDNHDLDPTQIHPVTTQMNQLVLDTPLTQGRWYYYTLFIRVVNQDYPQVGEWLTGAHVDVLVPRNYHHAEILFTNIPEYYQRLDSAQAADGINGPLRRYLRIIGYDADFNRTLLDGVLNIYDPDLAPLEFAQQVGANLGLPVENALGGARYRSIVSQLWDLEGQRGTAPGLQAFIYAASNYDTRVVQGHNSLLTPDDSEFVTGVGHWQAYTNPHVTALTNTVGNTHPAANPYTNLVLRPYTGTTVPALPAAKGRGIMEVIDVAATPTYLDMAIVCGLSQNGHPDPVTGKETDWLHYGIPVHANEIWELQFLTLHLAGAPNATAIGSFVYYDQNGIYRGTTPGPATPLTDSTAWQLYLFQFQFTQTYYVFPAIWWHAATALRARYLAAVQMALVTTQGANVAVVQPDIYLTLGTSDPNKELGGTSAHLGPPT